MLLRGLTGLNEGIRPAFVLILASLSFLSLLQHTSPPIEGTGRLLRDREDVVSKFKKNKTNVL